MKSIIAILELNNFNIIITSGAYLLLPCLYFVFRQILLGSKQTSIQTDRQPITLLEGLEGGLTISGSLK